MPRIFPIKWFLIGLLVFVAAILLESWRQSRKARRTGMKSTGRSFMGAGMLDLQGHLQPDRKVEYIKEDLKDKDRQNPAYHLGSVAEKKPDEE
jgi:hypothetical protein